MSEVLIVKAIVDCGPLLEPDWGGELAGECLVAGPRPMRPGRAQPERITWDRHSVGPPPAESEIGVG